MILLMVHILLGVASIAVGAVALAAKKSSLLKVQIGAFAGTIASGIGLVVISPSSLVHLCVSGAIFSAITIGLMMATSRRLAVVQNRI